MTKPLLKWLLILALFGGAVFFMVDHFSRKASTNTVIYPSLVSDIQELLRVTTLEGDRTVPVTLEENGVGAFALGSYKVRISYDVELLETFVMGDTLLVRLPQEDISIYENDRIGFRVLDVWGTTVWSRIGGVTLSIEQENRMRDQATKQLREALKNDGTVQKARTQAIHAVSGMLSIFPGTVIVLEPVEHSSPLMQPREVDPSIEVHPIRVRPERKQ